MATKAYFSWIAAGKPWDPCRPVAELEAWCDANGNAVLGTIGNEEHLTADPPEDHTPFAATAWPLPLPGYIVCAIDIEDEGGLGEAILASARRGELPWLKYCNIGQRHYHCRDGFQSSTFNSDTHIHLSIRTDFVGASIGDFDPLGGKDMADGMNEGNGLYAAHRIARLVDLEEKYPDGPEEGQPVPFSIAFHKLAADMAELKTRPPVQPAPVDPAVVTAAISAALRDPATLAAIAKAVNDEAHARSAA